MDKVFGLNNSSMYTFIIFKQKSMQSKFQHDTQTIVARMQAYSCTSKQQQTNTHSNKIPGHTHHNSSRAYIRFHDPSPTREIQTAW
jgi:hypothetical protein